jgi:hypothetical protein
VAGRAGAAGAVSAGSTNTPAASPGAARAATPRPGVPGESPRAGLPICRQEDEKRTPGTPAPCLSLDPQRQIQDNLAYLQRAKPRAEDAAALAGAAADLRQVFEALRARGVYDRASASQPVTDRPSLNRARVEPPDHLKLTTGGATVVVVLEHGSACLIGEHGPTESKVSVVGRTLDGGCEALYGH